MKKALLAFVILLSSVLMAQSQQCVENANEVAPTLSAETKQLYEQKLEEARENSRKLNDAESFIWMARRIAYLGSYKESVHLYSLGISKSEAAGVFNPKLYRHRGHRLITLRCFDDAIADFEKAAKLTKGKPDEVEADGLPNAKTSRPVRFSRIFGTTLDLHIT